MNIEKLIREEAMKLGNELDARIILYSGGVDRYMPLKVVNALQDNGPERNNTLLFLTTGGGLAGPAYQVARLIQQDSTEFMLCVPSFCKSAGTLLAIGAHRIYMNQLSELGPLDVQLPPKNHIIGRRSGMTVRTAMHGLAKETFDMYEQMMLNIIRGSGGSVGFDIASKHAADMAAGVMKSIYAQIHPDELGSDLRNLYVATAYGERLNAVSQNAKEKTIDILVEGYPSHDFIIDFNEAANLFHNVNHMTPNMLTLTNMLPSVMHAEDDDGLAMRLDVEPLEEIDHDHADVSERADASYETRQQEDVNGIGEPVG